MAGHTPIRDTVVVASARTKALLDILHAENERQAHSIKRIWHHIEFSWFLLWNWKSPDILNAYNDTKCTREFLSHSRETCELIYLLAILNRATNVVECGTSFGITTIYLALAIRKNVRGQEHKGMGVFTIEKDTSKVAKAREIWEDVDQEVANLIFSHEGDVLDFLANNGQVPAIVDMVFIDAWTSLALPSLMLVLPRLRRGSIVIADRTINGKDLYRNFLDFVRDPFNGFLSVTIPTSEGFEIMVYEPDELEL